MDDFVRAAAEWGAPERLARLVTEHGVDVAHEDFFGKPQFQPLKDGWQAAAFSRGYEACCQGKVAVRLTSHEGFPDFQLKLGDTVHDFESVMLVKRPLGRLYKGDARTGPVPTDLPSELPPFDMETLQRVVAKKVAKNYQGKLHLLVYVNASGGAAHFDEVSKLVREVVGDQFESVWLLGYGRMSGSPGAPMGNFIGCAKASPDLAECPGWFVFKEP